MKKNKNQENMVACVFILLFYTYTKKTIADL